MPQKLWDWYMLEPHPYEKYATLGAWISKLQGPKPGARRHQGGVDLALEVPEDGGIAGEHLP